MVQIFLCILLVTSIIGYVLFWISKGESAEIALGITFSFIGSVMFLAGIFNTLPFMTYAIIIGGVYLLIRIIQSKERVYKQLFSPGIIFFAVGTCFLFIILYGIEFTHYDSFSHWATVLKLIISKDRFPVASDINIRFQSYPLGSAAFIYYFTKTTTITAEWFQAFVQAVLIFGMLVSLFSVAKGVIGYILVAISVITLLIGNTSLVDLLVDTLLPATAISAFAFCLQHDKLDDKYSFAKLIIYLFFLFSIKNSGIFFIVAILGYLLIFKKINIKTLLYLLISLSVLVSIWYIRILIVFPQGLISKHSMSVAQYAANLNNKSGTDILEIAIEFIKRVFSADNYFL